MSGAFVYAAALGLCGGIALELLLKGGMLLALISLGVACVCVAAAVFLKKPLLFLVGAACAMTVLGIVRTDVLFAVQAQETLPQYLGETGIVRGTVAADPDRRATAVRVVVDVQTLNQKELRGKLLAVLPRETELAYGDTLEVRGTISAPEKFETDTGREFDYPRYLEVQGVTALIERGTVREVVEGGWSVRRALFDLRRVFEQSLERVLPEPEASLLKGVLLGERTGLPEGLLNAFVIASLIHVVVLSGYNISVIAEGVLRATSFLPRSFSYVVGSILMVLFIILTGAASTSLRAGVMALIALMARYFNRIAVALRSLAVAAAALAFVNPLVLLFDPSFILSVLATFGLVALSPWVEKYLPRFLMRLPQLRSMVASTIAVQLFVLPALLYMTGVLSFVGLPANVLVLPVVPFAMLFGFVAGVLQLVHPALAFLPALAADLCLWWMMFVANTAAALPFASVVAPVFPLWVALAVYVPLTAWAIVVYQRTAAPSRSSLGS